MCIQSSTVVDLWAHDGVDCTLHEVRCILRYILVYIVAVLSYILAYKGIYRNIISIQYRIFCTVYTSIAVETCSHHRQEQVGEKMSPSHQRRKEID